MLGFQLAGIRRAMATKSPAEFESKVDDVLSGREKNLGILIVNARDVTNLPAFMRKKLSDHLDPVVIQMGGEGGDLREKVKRAIGIDLVKE